MSKTDKELLELAAKAAGIDGSVDDEFGCGMWLRGKRNPDNSRYWSPLTDDGDAFRLAVKLGLDVDCSWTNQATVFSLKQEREAVLEPWGEDRNVAARRAITRAAAAIGESM